MQDRTMPLITLISLLIVWSGGKDGKTGVEFLVAIDK